MIGTHTAGHQAMKALSMKTILTAIIRLGINTPMRCAFMRDGCSLPTLRASIKNINPAAGMLKRLRTRRKMLTGQPLPPGDPRIGWPQCRQYFVMRSCGTGLPQRWQNRATARPALVFDALKVSFRAGSKGSSDPQRRHFAIRP
jgi:hypothetical protein